MVDPSSEVPLSPSVEVMLRRICEEQSLPSPDRRARMELASIGEETSLQLLREISGSRIRNLSGFIIYMAKKFDPVSTQESVCFSMPQQSSSSSGSISPQDDAISHSSSLEQSTTQTSSPSLSMERSIGPAFTPLLTALGELEFRKAFLILSYVGKKRLEDVITVDVIQKLKNLPMAKFESEVWSVLGRQCIEEIDRRKVLDWDSGKTYVYHCYVHPDGSYRFKGPYLDKKKTHLQRVLGDDNVLIVKFAEEVTDRSSSALSFNSSNAGYLKIAKEGILVGLRRYRFFVFKDGGKEEKKKNPASSPVKCYFVCMESDASSDEKNQYILLKKTVHEARCLFMHVHTVSSVAKYMARFSLILSKTLKLDVDLASVSIERIEDKPCTDEDGRIVYNEDGKPLIHTDGTGFISEDLALKCPRNISKTILDRAELEEQSSELRQSKSPIWEPVQQLLIHAPLLIQFRLFNNGCAVKGTFLVNKKLPPKTVQIRPSMIKVETDPQLSLTQTANSLEIVGTSNQPKKTYLSRFLIALLSYGGVPRKFFMDVLTDSLDAAQKIHSNKRAALKVALRYGEMDDFLVSRMILCGIPLNEPYMQCRLSVLLRDERKGLKGGKIPVSECYYLMGTADPTGLLRSDQVCIILDTGPISGEVLVYKHPGLHFGDIHVLTAIYVKEIVNIVGNAKFAIFFPTNGPRSLADEIANSDFDGDMYWVSQNPQLLNFFQASKPWERAYSTNNFCNRKPTEFSDEELENELFQRFLTTRFRPSNTIGVAADSWLAYIDRLLTLGTECASEIDCVKGKMLQLIDIYYDALDAPKTGMKVEVPKDLKAEKFPHFMERANSYVSTSILGLIYDTVDSIKTVNPSEEVWKLSCFDVEVPQACLELWKEYYCHYRGEMTVAMKLEGESKNESACEVIQKYKQILYGAVGFEESTRKREEIFNEALAIYQVTYDFAKTKGAVSYCNFAWKVAGPALCELHAIKQRGESIVCLPSVLREVLN